MDTNTSTPSPLLTTPALELVAAELRRVQLQLGYTAARDDQYTAGELVAAAKAYLNMEEARERTRGLFLNAPRGPSKETLVSLCGWPWPADTFKPAADDSTEGRIRELVKAVELAVSEIGRLQRAAGITMQTEPLPTFDLIAYLHRQIAFSTRTFGPGDRTNGVCDHIRKELAEVEADQAGGRSTLPEWVDVILLALDGAWRSGATPAEVCAGIDRKLTVNENRLWPDWRTADRGKAIEHVRGDIKP